MAPRAGLCLYRSGALAAVEGVMPDHLSLLRRVSIFEGLGETDLAELAACFEPRRFLAGAVVVGQDDPGDSLFVIAEGRVKVVLFGRGGRELILSVFRSGDFFGEMSLLDGQPRSATVVATEDARLLELSREVFAAFVDRHPRLALLILAEMSRRLRRADEIIGNLGLLDVYSRLGHQLRELAAREGEEGPEGVRIAKRPTQQELAAMIGTTRETVSRVLADFQRQGLLEMAGKALILRPALLRR